MKLRSIVYLLAALVVMAMLFFFPPAHGQAPASEELAGTAARPNELVVSPVKGFNFAMSYNAQHNSATGWANVVGPTLSYRINRNFALAASTLWYPSLNAYVLKGTGTSATYTLKPVRNVLGDTSVNGSYQLALGDLSYIVTATGGFPTGNAIYGLSANTMTYNVTHHFDYSLGPFNPDVEMGIGDSSSLANRTVRKAYTASGTIANFQAGTSIDLPWHMSLDLEAYENLPIGDQNVYGTVTTKNKKGVTVTKQVLQGKGLVEDNGFNTEFDVPLGPRLTLQGMYERSLRQGLDSAAFGLTWTLRAPTVGVPVK